MYSLFLNEKLQSLCPIFESKMQLGEQKLKIYLFKYTKNPCGTQETSIKLIKNTNIQRFKNIKSKKNMGLNESVSTIYSTKKPMLKYLKHDSEKFVGRGWA